jgi:hypothetical protein
MTLRSTSDAITTRLALITAFTFLAYGCSPHPAKTEKASSPQVATDLTTATTRFRHFLDVSIAKALAEDGDKDAKPDYRIVATDDLNGDGMPDFIIFNETLHSCGSGGCSYEVYVATKNGYAEIEAPELFAKSSVLVRQSHGPWKDIFTTDNGDFSSYPAYHRNIYDVAKSSYVEVESWFCGSLNFEYCSNPILFCSVDGTNLNIHDNAPVFRAPYDEKFLASDAEQSLNSTPLTPDQEPGYITGETSDGRWFLVLSKSSGPHYVRSADVSGDLPAPRSPCE